MRSVLILSNTSDITTDVVVKKIEGLGGHCIRLNVDELYDTKSSIRFKGSSFSFTSQCNAISFSYSDLISIWSRRPVIIRDLEHLSAEDRTTIRELHAFMRSIAQLSPKDLLVVNNPVHDTLAINKLFQLQVAAQLGFTVPDTIVTNSLDDLQVFLDKHDKNVILKKIEQGSAADPKKSFMIYTTKFSDALDLSLLKNCPTLFQEDIPKETELRITILGRKIFAIEFESQQLEDARADWRSVRSHIRNVPHRFVTLPLDVQDKLLGLMEYYDLRYGAAGL
jgi:glutathione synthase/RimK-type ligase-like ATP-grasp enzyme